ncbi:MAG: bifunctional phosphopantothenoylcysteine decarboxylase/phosphopantothenate--cysteine ligase CoaBC [Muribaculum sp.]|nr:bifunctional phosphopantothenoylcysteine decarboxylase/phosphopantothenate--cysteine ligase CoaBC [Muribaculaceae bacterium]MCM1081409.1 bifunctional phosphopantothenoylcysteine decarboxylase/phosphopantothenate--cysteine ligase CoaBC [Muribaculum sp.]
MSSLSGKHIILGITGGIAAYKSAVLLRLLIKAGAEVQVVMTPSAKEFITPVTLSALSGKPVVSEFFTANTGQWNSHVDLGIWADVMIIAPATACTIGKMANGIADNMLVTTYLSAKAPVFIAPAMDLDMMAHPSTVANLERLRSYGNHIIEPTSGELASHLTGKGRMQEPEIIVDELSRFFATKNDLAGKNIIITAGPTYERIDPVRYIGNFSTGKMGYAIADECARRGAKVIVVSGPCSIKPTELSVKVEKVESAKQMLEACKKVFPNCDIAIMCAAVADYNVANASSTKIKREGNEPPILKLEKNPDIARTLGMAKRPEQKVVGFALETDNEEANAKKKLEAKNLDMIVMNSLRDSGAGFGTDTNHITIYTRDGRKFSFETKSKASVATDIINTLLSL